MEYPSWYGFIIEDDDPDCDMKCDDICMGCEGLAIVYYEPKYHGLRAKCPDCDINWAVS
ncbi:MAG: hypothetical protein KGI05_08500 [Thaumarchaeota archaeon]|nr:hypothetical protein [Nitrososphaerota archaeon]